jgi:hypothetical protein
MSVRASALAAAGWLVLCAAVAPACKRPSSDDVDITRDDRPKATKKEPEKVEYDRTAVCRRLGELTDAGALSEDEQAEQRELCLNGLAAVKARDRVEFDCRCKCILEAPDLTGIEQCQARCLLRSLEAVCDHAAGLETSTNDADVLADAQKKCVEQLKLYKEADRPRYVCLSKCLFAAKEKPDALACADACDPSVAKTDAGSDADATP